MSGAWADMSAGQRSGPRLPWIREAKVPFCPEEMGWLRGRSGRAVPGGLRDLPALRGAANPGTRQARARVDRSGTTLERWCAGEGCPLRSDVPSGFSSAIGEPSWSGPRGRVPGWPPERSVRGLERGKGTPRVRSSGLRSSAPARDPANTLVLCSRRNGAVSRRPSSVEAQVSRPGRRSRKTRIRCMGTRMERLRRLGDLPSR